ncbi:hypothetical protein [Flavobacterium frigoris]|uniref:Uncharacterized protein n=1 Tax=Flavobacterium frigoris (strain PS1) TaxID=1086011 RepID=H7FN30_FLAFP|nr:hypothetical protein [Flavobacterium frigoris]EIA09822.1 hypothetical protein HJ01_00504 [Flavobacterium frigoris PS1]
MNNKKNNNLLNWRNFVFLGFKLIVENLKTLLKAVKLNNKKNSGARFFNVG